MAVNEAVDAIFTAARWGDVDRAIRLLDQDGGLVGVRSQLHYTPLLLAARWGRTDVVRVLLERGAAVNEVDEFERTALHWAADGRRGEVADLLLRHGADANRGDMWGITALKLAAQKGQVGLVRKLLQHMNKGRLNARDHYGQTALSSACSDGHVEVARALLLAGADHTIADGTGQTPRQVAEGSTGGAPCAALLQVRQPRSSPV
jgi:ankyrin repeat protein